jgi:hypothetical protein
MSQCIIGKEQSNAEAYNSNLEVHICNTALTTGKGVAILWPFLSPPSKSLLVDGGDGGGLGGGSLGKGGINLQSSFAGSRVTARSARNQQRVNIQL